jgi:hypothetical protein
VNVSASSEHARVFWPQAKQVQMRIHCQRIRQHFADDTIEALPAAGAQDVSICEQSHSHVTILHALA